MQSEDLKAEASRPGRGLLASIVSILTLLALALAGCSSPWSGTGANARLAQALPGMPRLTASPAPPAAAPPNAGGASQNADPIQVQGSIQSLPDGRLHGGVWEISGLAVQVTPTTNLDQRVAPAAPGAEVEVYGWLQLDGSLQADWIRVLSPARPIADAGPSPLRIILPPQGTAATSGGLASLALQDATAVGADSASAAEAGVVNATLSPATTGQTAASAYEALIAELFGPHPPQRLDVAQGSTAAEPAPASQIQPAAQQQPSAQPVPAVWQPPAPAAPPPAPPPSQAPPPVVVPPVVAPPVIAPPPPVVVPPVIAPPPQSPPAGQPGDNGGGHRGKGSKGGSGPAAGAGKDKGHSRKGHG